MKTSQKLSLVLVTVLMAASGCTKDNDYIPPSGGGGTTPPPAKQVQCYNATPTSLSRKNSAMLCSGAGVGVNAAYAPTDTVTKCYNSTPLAITDGQASLVCAGSPDQAPVDCINNGGISALDNFNAAVLCSSENNPSYSATNPVGCFNNSSLSLFDNEAAVLCQSARSTTAANDCYANTPLSLAEPDAAELCSQTGVPGTGVGTAALDCYAQSPLSLSDSDAALLCQKSSNATTTLDCYANTPSYLTDHEAAILCSGAASSAAANACINATSTDLSNADAAFMCSGAGSQGTASTAPVSCYSTTSTNLSLHDSAILCSANAGLLTSMYTVNTQYNNRAVAGGANGRNSVNGNVAFQGDVDAADTMFVKADPRHTSARGGAPASQSRKQQIASARSGQSRKGQNVGATRDGSQRLGTFVTKRGAIETNTNRIGATGSVVRSDKSARSTLTAGAVTDASSIVKAGYTRTARAAKPALK